MTTTTSSTPDDDRPAVAIGSGAGFSGDRPDAARAVVQALAEHNGPRYLMYETLGERSLAIAQGERIDDESAGFHSGLAQFLRPILPLCIKARIRIVANFGAANPTGAAEAVVRLMQELDLGGVVVAIEGDDLLQHQPVEAVLANLERPLLLDGRIVGASVYLGAEPIADALRTGADVVLVGRTADSALALGPLVAEFGWRDDDWDLLAAGSLAGHLLECGAQVSGGYFADPGYKDVPLLADVGMPLAIVNGDGTCTITKPPGSGGLVSLRTVAEQLLYEVHDPGAYLLPDVTLDLTGVQLSYQGPDKVGVSGARGRPKPSTLKATVGVEGEWLGESEISYAGPGAQSRAALAADVLAQRISGLGLDGRLRIDVIGVSSTLDSDGGGLRSQRAPTMGSDVRVRLAFASAAEDIVRRAVWEVDALYTNGPAGGAGVRTSVRRRIQTVSVFVARGMVVPTAKRHVVPSE